MLLLNYWEYLSKSVLLVGVIRCMGKLFLLVAPCVLVLLLIRMWIKPPATSFLCGVLMLLFAREIGMARALPGALLGALAGTVTELYSSGELDTVTVPVVIEAVLLILSF